MAHILWDPYTGNGYIGFREYMIMIDFEPPKAGRRIKDMFHGALQQQQFEYPKWCQSYSINSRIQIWGLGSASYG